MEKVAAASLSVGLTVFGFDPDPSTPSGRALHVLTARQRLVHTEVMASERRLCWEMSSPVTTCCGYTWRFTVDLRVASGPSGVGSKSCVMQGCCAQSSRLRWPDCALASLDFVRQVVLGAGPQSCSATPG